MAINAQQAGTPSAVLARLARNQPRTLADLTTSPESTALLAELARAPNPPHLLLHGRPGSGKYTRAMLFLREIHDDSVFRLRTEARQLAPPAELDIPLTLSDHHVELNPSLYGLRDRLVIQHVLEASYAQTATMTCVIFQADRMSPDAQFALRRAMEAGRWRYIFLTENPSGLMRPLRSRCIAVRVAAPDSVALRKIADAILQREAHPVAPAIIERLVAESSGNIRLLMLRLFVVIETGSSAKAPWRSECEAVVRTVAASQSVDTVRGIVAGSLCRLVSSGVAPDTVLATLTELFLRLDVDELVKLGIVETAVKFDLLLQQGKSPWVHLEAFLTAVTTLFSAGSRF